MALLLAPLRWLTSSIIRVAILAAILVVAYLVLLKPAIEGGEQKVDNALHSLGKQVSPRRLAHCVDRADGNLGRLKRCARPF